MTVIGHHCCCGPLSEDPRCRYLLRRDPYTLWIRVERNSSFLKINYLSLATNFSITPHMFHVFYVANMTTESIFFFIFPSLYSHKNRLDVKDYMCLSTS